MKRNETKLFVVIHSEIEFDWSKNEFLDSCKVSHGDALIELCNELISYNVRIILAVDYGFIASEDGQRVIKYFKQHPNHVTFASHMHPWNTPPFSPDTVINEKLSFPGNLDYQQEFDKIASITEALSLATGIRPDIYLAGRYGIGRNTNKILTEQGYNYDISISPFTDFSANFGPNFIDYDNHHFIDGRIQYYPHTVGFISIIAKFSDFLNRHKHVHYQLNSHFIGKIILRLLRVKRVRLSSEGFTFKEVAKLCDSLVRNHSEFLLFSFHSSSLVPGSTFYAHTTEECEQLKQRTLEIIKHLVTHMKLKPASLKISN